MTAETKTGYTVAEFMQLDDDGNRYELIRGELVEMPGPSSTHLLVIGVLTQYLRNFLDANPIGRAGSGGAFELNPRYAPVPDVAFVRIERWSGVNLNGAFPGPPDLAIEVLSPTDKWMDVVNKTQDYLEAGTRLVWVVDPFDKNVFVYRADHTKNVLSLGDELDGEDVLPNFKLKVETIFQDLA